MNSVAIALPAVVLAIAELSQKHLPASARSGLDVVLTWIMMPGMAVFWAWQAVGAAAEKGGGAAWAPGLMAAAFSAGLLFTVVRGRGVLSDGRWLG